MATLLAELKTHLVAAMKASAVVDKEILRVAIGEIETAASRVDAFDDEAARGVLRKLVKSNEETRALEPDAATQAVLAREIEVLRGFLPRELGVDELVALLDPVRDAVRAATNDGQATGVAMKHLKVTGVTAPGKAVGDAVRRLRA
ncbi:MAG: GatB/YqeY domain-containing protein [Polyangiaceae bacterium]|nr:GatB/YqeY domain-containing protein [Polyangiaceae bacterium]